MKKEAKNYGKAYAFFDCRASKKQVEAELPKIRQCVQTPSNLELSFIGCPIGPVGDNGVIALAQEARYGGATNRQTADEIAAVLNQAYQSPLYADKEEFRGAIIYQDMGEYVSRN